MFILNSDEYHAEGTVAALDAGIHVLVEKPMCLSPREAEEIIAARDRCGKAVMVAYMRRFAPAFKEAVERLPELGEIRYARVHDVIGENRLIIDQTWNVDRPDDIPQEAVDDQVGAAFRAGQGGAGRRARGAGVDLRLLCGLGSHDLSAMRELLGRPREGGGREACGAAAATSSRCSTTVTSCVTYETGVDDQLRFDAHIEVYGESGTMRVQYDTPYVRHFPTTLHLETTVGDAYERTVVRPHLKDPYTYELEHFHEVVTSGGTPKTTPEDFVADLELFVEIIRALQTT